MEPVRTIWFRGGTDHRRCGAKTAWARKPPDLQIAIILANNQLGIDLWELLKAEYQVAYLKEARELLSEGVTAAAEGTLGADTGPGRASGP